MVTHTRSKAALVSLVGLFLSTAALAQEDNCSKAGGSVEGDYCVLADGTRCMIENVVSQNQCVTPEGGVSPMPEGPAENKVE